MSKKHTVLAGLAVFGLGFGTGLRTLPNNPPMRPVKALTPEPIQSHAPTPVFEPAGQQKTSLAIFQAICLWEGRGRIDLAAINTSEGAHGPAQIRQGYLTDSGLPYTLEDCHSYDISYQVACAYWARYHMITDEGRARSHNGGPHGPVRDSTLGYWAGVQSFLR